MDGIPLQLIYRDMLFPGGFRCAGHQFLHFLTAAVNRDTFIPDHSDDISAMLANIEFLFHKLPPSKQSVS
jgi:hypothetical protein